MRGELGTRLDNFTNRGATPSSTPSTASTNRSHPPNYQRMLSNGSDKENGSNSVNSRAPEWLDSPLVATKKLKNQTNRFPKSSSPARQWLSPGRTGGRSIPLLKNQVQTTMPHSNNRRSSAAGITHRPPTYPLQSTIKTRSQSLDGLLDVATATNTKTTSNQINQIAEGASDININRLNNSDIEKDNNKIEESSNKRKSKSMEDLLDTEIRDDQSRAKSEDTKISSSTSLEQPREEETIIIDNSKSCEDLDKTDDDKKFIRQESTNSLPVKGKNTFLNRYVKKVKSFIKKWQKSFFE